MKNLALRLADDKLYCLSSWDSKQKTFLKIAEGRICKQLDKYGYRFLLGNDEKDCQVYAEINGELQIIPVHCQNAVFIGDICTYERNGEWYGFIAGNEVLLGKRYEFSLSLKEYYQLSGPGAYYYFVSGDEAKEYVLSVIYRSVLIQGIYCGALYRQEKDYLLARRKDGNYDILSPRGFFVYEEDKRLKRYFCDERRVYFWDEARSSWKMIAEDGFVVAGNALIIHYKDANDQTYSILFEVVGTSLKEHARGKFKVYRDGSFSIGEMMFFEDYKQNRVDFLNWRYSFMGKLKKLLGK